MSRRNCTDGAVVRMESRYWDVVDGVFVLRQCSRDTYRVAEAENVVPVRSKAASRTARRCRPETLCREARKARS